MALSVSFNMLKLLAEELKATDYTLTQSSLDQVSESNSAIPGDLSRILVNFSLRARFLMKLFRHVLSRRRFPR